MTIIGNKRVLYNQTFILLGETKIIVDAKFRDEQTEQNGNLKLVINFTPNETLQQVTFLPWGKDEIKIECQGWEKLLFGTTVSGSANFGKWNGEEMAFQLAQSLASREARVLTVQLLLGGNYV
jgi:hypothetical protein